MQSELPGSLFVEGPSPGEVEALVDVLAELSGEPETHLIKGI